MTRNQLLSRIKYNNHRVILWKRYKEIVKQHPEKYRMVYDFKRLKFMLQTRTFRGWKAFAESSEWDMKLNGT